MKKLNIIDLDKTLIPFDSFRYYLLNLLWSIHFYRIIPLIFKRILKLSNETNFKESVVERARKVKNYNKLLLKIKDESMFKINEDVLNLIRNNSDSNTINVICSASPRDYVRYISDELGWKCLASDFIENNFVNMKGSNKIKYLRKFFPESEYSYNYSVSDSRDDLELLKLFKEYKLLS